MLERIIGVLRLDVNTFEEIEADENATMEAAIIVAVVAVMSAIGAFFGARASASAFEQLEGLGGAEGLSDLPLPDFITSGISPVGAAVNAVLAAFITWILWSALTYFIGTNLFNGDATLGEMLRVIGYAQAPQLLSILAPIPCLGCIISLAIAIWSLAAGFIAIRQGLDLDNGKTAITVILSWFAALIVNLLIVAPITALLL